MTAFTSRVFKSTRHRHTYSQGKMEVNMLRGVKRLVSVIILLSAFHSNAQFAKMSFNTTVIINSDTLALPWTGGMNQPQFSQLDMNEDGLKDLFVFDKNGSKIMCFIAESINGAISYYYDPSFEDRFPHGSDFMLLKDANGDKIPDLWFDANNHVYVSPYEQNDDGFIYKFPKDSLYAYRFYDETTETEIHSSIGQYFGNYPAIVDVDFDGDIDFFSNADLCEASLGYHQNTTVDRNFSVSDTMTFDVPDLCFGHMREINNELVLGADCKTKRSYRFNKKHCSTKTIFFYDDDGDGDSDLFLGNSENRTVPFTYFKNGKKEFNLKVDSFIKADTMYFDSNLMDKISIAPAIFKADIELDGLDDLIFASFDSYKGGSNNQTNQVVQFKNDGSQNKPNFKYITDEFLVGDMIDLGGHVSPALTDIDGDGDLDLFVANNGDFSITRDTADRIAYFENIGSKSNPVFEFVTYDFLDLAKEGYQQMKPNFGDINGDGLSDLLIGTESDFIKTYLNTTKNGVISFEHSTISLGDILYGFNLAPYLYDINNDGLLDLFLGQYEGNTNLYLNKGITTEPLFKLKDDLLGDTLINALEWVKDLDENGNEIDRLEYVRNGYSSPVVGDLENDGNIEMVVGTYQGTVMKFEMNGNNTNGQFYMNDQFFTLSNKHRIKYDFGQLSTPAIGDLNDDGIQDFIIGNDRGGLNYFEGSSVISVPNYIKSRSINVYPNPTKDKLTITLDGQTVDYIVYDRLGKEITSGNDATINVSDWHQGMYFVSGYHQDEVYHAKFLVIK